MRVGIIGLGGVGGYYGGLLARSGGVSVHALARGDHLAAVAAHGLEVQTPEERWIAPVVVSDNASELARPFSPDDFALISVKAYSLPDVASAMKAFAERGATLVPLLNGVDIAERLVALGIPAAQILGGVTYISAVRAGPGVVARKSPFQRVLVGEMTAPVSPRAERIARALRTAGADAVTADDIGVELWRKFVFLSTIAAVCGLARSPIGQVRDDGRGWETIEGALDEVLAVARARGIDLPHDERARALDAIRALPPQTKPSLLLDLEAGRPTEVEVLSGTISRYAKEAGIDTPVHDSATFSLIHHANGAAVSFDKG